MMRGWPKRMRTPGDPSGAGVGVPGSDTQTCVGVTNSGTLQLFSFVFMYRFSITFMITLI